ncbi:glycosyl transferase [Pseudohongiella nitratireducens]|uniref:Glycosyl transferase n=1 Tax=Pseudohongiella nitratireducens TaxID=1768907 RepID=A0A917LNZ6_9GAMM|nr:glycosyltransferase family 2 protein [Pseudohongiella nitratireducens]GGG48365.1 glycosyl transferase [Pseudohongiella nitratireducens]
MPIAASVIITTYNSPDWLKKVLWGYFQQTRQDFEIIIADDGSGDPTAQLISGLATLSPVPIQHVWQPDDGFQKCRILNKAIVESQSEYLVFSDGDCIPRNDFIATHLRRAEPGYYLSGGTLNLPMDISQTITRQHIEQGLCFDKHWLYQQGLKKNRKISRISLGPKQAALMNRLTPVRCNFKGSNASCWKTDAIAVNGFNENMPYGGLDREFGVRLQNHGITPRHVRFDAAMVHLDHAKSYRDPAKMAANKALRKQMEKDGTVKSPLGISELLASGYSAGRSSLHIPQPTTA